jgi:hypothetical protein
MLNGYLTANPDNLDPAASGNNAAANVICNIYKSLGESAVLQNEPVSQSPQSLKEDISPQSLQEDISPQSLKEDVSPGSLQSQEILTFALNENYWNNGERVTAADYKFGLERMGYTDGKDGNVIKVVNENTLELSANFEKKIGEIYPCNEKFFNNAKGRYGLDDENVLSNGDFYVTKWFYDPYGKDNILNISRNNYNSQVEKTYPTKIYYKIVNSDGSDYYVSDKPSRSNMVCEEYKVGTLGLVFNFESDDLKKVLAMSINRSSDDTDRADGGADSVISYGIVPDTVSVLGKSYREIINEKNLSKYDAAAAKSLYESSPEITDTMSKNFKITANVNDISSSELIRITKYWNELFGITVSFDLLEDDEYNTKLQSRDFEIAVYRLTLDENNPETYLKKIKDKIDTNLNIDNYFNELSGKKNLSECVEIYGEIEKEFSSTGIFCPVKWKIVYLEHTKQTKDIEYRSYNNTVYFKNAKYFED